MNRIGDYALIGDCHSAALVGRDGSVDWACFPRFDSPSVFCAILDADNGGRFALSPRGPRSSRRHYVEDTNVLVTEIDADGGVVEITDCMPVETAHPSDPSDLRTHHSILRRARCIEGSIALDMSVAARFEYGLFTPRFRLTSDKTGEIVGGADALWITASRPLDRSDDAIAGRWQMRHGDEVWIEVAWSTSHEIRDPTRALDPAQLEARLEATIAFWRAWIAKCWYEGEHPEAVRRSALALKALTYAPSGALVAAPTTSLPEELGGHRNWDYRYTWIRDATLTLISLFILGLREEADDFKTWLERTGAGRPEDLQIMYGICGERSLPERQLDHLAGHAGSAPVRIGNGAVKQMQLDCYGQILEAAYLYSKAGGKLTQDNWKFLSGLSDIVCQKWSDPDHGIWEMRDEPRHFVHSKLNCWLALDRAVKLADVMGLPERATGWREQREAVRSYLIEEAAPGGWFRQAVGVDAADAATLLVPALGILPTNDPLVQATIERVSTELLHDGLVYRYLSPDGLAGGEGAFLLCSFWLLDCLTHSGRLDEADALLDRLLGLANDVGLYAEEVDPATGEALGNFPQAFTHMALVLSCSHLSAAKKGQVPFDGAHNYAELALERLLSLHS